MPEAVILLAGETWRLPADWTKTHAAPIRGGYVPKGPPTIAVLPSADIATE
jgi:hypothetical protein